jgi:hypothetical protein
MKKKTDPFYISLYIIRNETYQKSYDVFHFQETLRTINHLEKYRHTLFNIHDQSKMPFLQEDDTEVKPS